jgi:hypothetical protein
VKEWSRTAFADDWEYLLSTVWVESLIPLELGGEATAVSRCR